MTIEKKLTNLKFNVCNACIGPAWLLHGAVLNKNANGNLLYVTHYKGPILNAWWTEMHLREDNINKTERDWSNIRNILN